MKQKNHAPQNRLILFDNLRYLMVLLVLVFHSGASYGSMVAFWPYHDPNPSELIDHIMPLFDVFMMSILFFIGGFSPYCSCSLLYFGCSTKPGKSGAGSRNDLSARKRHPIDPFTMPWHGLVY